MSLYSQLDRLASDLETVKKQLHAVANTNQLQRTSVEGGAIEFNDEDGNLKAIMGGQEDGGYTTVVVSGPVPPVPTNYGVDVDFGKAVVHWSGDFENALVAPSDWSRTEVYAQPGAFVSPSREYARGSMVAASGGSVTIGLTKGQWTFCLVAWSQAGRMSAMSTPVTVDIPGYGDIVLAEIDAAETAIKNAGEMLVDGQQTLADKLANMGEGMDPEQIAQDIATARQEAIDAALEEINAVEGSLTSLIGDKNTTTWSTSNPPTEYAGVVGYTWIKLTSLGSGGREIERRRWSGTAWVVHKVDGAVLSNVDASTITAGFLDVANRIRSGSIFADKLLIGSGGNLIPNPDFSTGWGRLLSVVPGEGKDGSNLVRISASTSTSGGYSGGTSGLDPLHAKVTGGSFYRVSAWVRSDIEIPPNSASLYVRAFTPQDGIDNSFSWASPTTLGNRDAIPANTWSLVSGIVEMPEGAIEATLGLYSRYTFDHVMEYCLPSIQSATDGTLITPGGVQTPHLAADVLEVGNLKAGTAEIAEAVVKKLFAEVVVAEMVQAQEFIGENAILTGAVTAPKITASEELWAKLAQFVTVYAEMVDADVFNGRVFRGSTFLTTNESSWSDRGMFLLDDEGNPRIQAPTDGSDFTVNAEIVAKSLTAAGRASFLSENNRLEPGAGLVLAAGVGDPPSPPVVSNHYKQITPPALVEGESVSGLAFGDGLFWRAIDAGSGNNPLDRIEGIDRDGVIQRTIPLVNFWARNGLAVIGDELFALGIRDDRPENVRNQERWVRVFGLDGTYKRQWEYPNYGTGTYQPGIGSTPAGNVSIAQCWVDGKLSWRTFSPTGTFINITTRDAPVKSDAVGIYGGTADFGANRTVFAKGFTPGTNRQFTVYGTNGNDYFPEQSWYSPGRGDVKGLAWDGEKFYSIDPAGVITEYGSLNMGDDSANWWATYRWVGSSGKTTRIAPPARFAWARRSRLRVSAPNLPQGVTTIEPSLAFKTTTPTRSEFRSPAWAAGATPSTVNYEVLPTSWQSGAAPGDINNFPNSTPSSVKASTGLFEVRGDGSGRWGPLTFNPDGSMSSSAVPAWVPITEFASGFSAGSFGFAPAYRVWPDGKVEWRGTVEGNVTAYSHDAFTIPSAALPTQSVQGEVATSAGTGAAPALTRCEFRPESATTKFRVYQGGTNRSWFSLDQNWYYKS